MKKGWEKKKLGEVCQIELGKTPSRANKTFWDEEKETGNVWLSIADLHNGEDRIVSDSKEYISEKGAELCRKVNKGTLMVSFKLTLGRLAYAGIDLYTNEAIASLTLNNEKEVSKEYLYWFLRFFDWVGAAEGDIKIKGMTLNKAKLKEIEISFPPLPEQKRIVGILDEAFEGIATAKANAEKNLQNARALFESHLNEVFTKRGEGWVERRFGDIAEFRNGINFTRTSKGATVAIVGVKDFQENYWVKHDGLDTVTIDGELDESDIVKEGDLLFVRSNGNPELIGRCMLVGEIVTPTTHSGFTIRARVSCPELLPEYLTYYLKTASTRRKMIDGGNGANIRSLNQGTLASLAIFSPAPKTQLTIISQIKNCCTHTQRLESIYQQKLAALEDLKKSLLHQAFNGDL